MRPHSSYVHRHIQQDKSEADKEQSFLLQNSAQHTMLEQTGLSGLAVCLYYMELLYSRS